MPTGREAPEPDVEVTVVVPPRQEHREQGCGHRHGENRGAVPAPTIGSRGPSAPGGAFPVVIATRQRVTSRVSGATGSSSRAIPRSVLIPQLTCPAWQDLRHSISGPLKGRPCRPNAPPGRARLERRVPAARQLVGPPARSGPRPNGGPPRSAPPARSGPRAKRRTTKKRTASKKRAAAKKRRRRRETGHQEAHRQQEAGPRQETGHQEPASQEAGPRRNGPPRSAPPARSAPGPVRVGRPARQRARWHHLRRVRRRCRVQPGLRAGHSQPRRRRPGRRRRACGPAHGEVARTHVAVGVLLARPVVGRSAS